MVSVEKMKAARRLLDRALQKSLKALGYQIARQPAFSSEFLSGSPFLEGMDPREKEMIKVYIKDLHKVHGWFHPRMIKVISLTHIFQQIHQIKGSLAEIGVLHGKSFLPLYIFCGQGSTAVAIDLFVTRPQGPKSPVIDNHKIFIRHVQIYGRDDCKKLRVIKANSLSVDAERIKKESNREGFRIFSVDGAHTSEATLRDLQNAHATLVKGGVLMIDDYFQPTWPGVSEAFNRFMSQTGMDLKPFFIGFNKILLTQASYAEAYRKFIVEGMGEPQKRSVFFESEVLVYPQ